MPRGKKRQFGESATSHKNAKSGEESAPNLVETGDDTTEPKKRPTRRAAKKEPVVDADIDVVETVEKKSTRRNAKKETVTTDAATEPEVSEKPARKATKRGAKDTEEETIEAAEISEKPTRKAPKTETVAENKKPARKNAKKGAEVSADIIAETVEKEEKPSRKNAKKVAEVTLDTNVEKVEKPSQKKTKSDAESQPEPADNNQKPTRKNAKKNTQVTVDTNAETVEKEEKPSRKNAKKGAEVTASTKAETVEKEEKPSRKNAKKGAEVTASTKAETVEKEEKPSRKNAKKVAEVTLDTNVEKVEKPSQKKTKKATVVEESAGPSEKLKPQKGASMDIASSTSKTMPVADDIFVRGLAVVLDGFSLHELIRYRSVSPQFKSAVEYACKERDSLKLFESYDEIKTYCLDMANTDSADAAVMKLKPIGRSDDLVIPTEDLSLKQGMKFNDDYHAFLKGLLPNIQHLVVYNKAFDSDLLNLLKLWPNLKSLSINGDAMPLDEFQFYKQFHSLLNLMTGLERLDLNLNDRSKIRYDDLKDTLGRLKYLSLKNPPEDITTVLNHIGPNLSHLRLGDTSSDLAEAINTNLNLASITHFSLNGFEDGEVMSNIYEHLTELKYLNLDLVDHAFELPYMSRIHDLLSTIGTLTKLEELRITNSDLNLAYLDDSSVTPINSMKILHLDDADEEVKDDYGDSPRFDGKDWCNKLQTLFPKLQQLTVRSKNKARLSEIRKSLKSNLKTLKQNLICSKDDRKYFIDYFGRHQERYKKDRRGNKPKPVKGLVYAFED